MAREMLSQFWSPLCAVGAPGPHGPNAQICLSVFGASIVPERPRLMVILSNTNFTTGLIAKSGRLSISLLAEGQLKLLERLGLQSGRDAYKLDGIRFEMDSHGCPLFEASAATASCEVLESSSLGDSTAFLCAVRERVTNDREPISWFEARSLLNDEFLLAWQEKSEGEQQAARRTMLWR
jgi:flavin reductase (DIM6/NTAB) family NADH-FMN oxidoreductase RutF